MSKFTFAVIAALMTLSVAGQALALNPQPLPPRWVTPPLPPHPEPVPHVPVVHY